MRYKSSSKGAKTPILWRKYTFLDQNIAKWHFNQPNDNDQRMRLWANVKHSHRFVSGIKQKIFQSGQVLSFSRKIFLSLGSQKTYNV